MIGQLLLAFIHEKLGEESLGRVTHRLQGLGVSSREKKKKIEKERIINGGRKKKSRMRETQESLF